MEQQFININCIVGIQLWSYLYMCKYRWGAENTQRPCYRNRPAHVYFSSGSKAMSHIRPSFQIECSRQNVPQRTVYVMPISLKGIAKKKKYFQCNMHNIHQSVFISENLVKLSQYAVSTFVIVHFVSNPDNISEVEIISISQIRMLRLWYIR